MLPAARIFVFARDEATLKTAQALASDWRFARVEIATENGDIEDAISAFSDAASPELIVIQTDVLDKAFTKRLEALAEHCDEGTSAIVIGPDNDVNLYRQLIDMGVSDYLVRPLDVAVFAEVIAKALIDKIGVSGSRLVAVLGAKGGVGASIVSEALACGVSEILGQKTLLLDTAGGWSSLAVGMGFEPSTTLIEAAKAAENNDEDSLARMMFKPSANLKVLATGGDVMLEHTIEPEQLEALIDMIMTRTPMVVADLSNSPEGLQKVVISRASQIVIVSTPTLPALRLARALMNEIRGLRGGSDSDISLVVNMQGMAGKIELSKADIETAMEFSVSAFLPYDAKMFLGNESDSKKLTDDKGARALIETVLLPILGLDMAVSEGGAGVVSKGGGVLSGLLAKLPGKK